METFPSTQTELEKIGNRIKALRKQRGYRSYEIFAYEHNIHRSQWGKYEKGANLNFVTLVKITAVLGVSLKEFFSEGFD
ncbi:MAG: helix-turn-helix transcriptional regulator [Bacteroidetes bacterium]|nr:helix-turn-helix transcriptional regulator [Bacteroidota bacterium]